MKEKDNKSNLMLQLEKMIQNFNTNYLENGHGIYNINTDDEDIIKF